MKFPSYLTVALGALLALSTGCADATQPGEPPVIAPPVAPPVAPPAPQAAVVATYQRLGETSPRYVLREDGSFSLEYDYYLGGVIGYPGMYQRADTVITFKFDISSTAYSGATTYSRWEATGTVRGDTLAVKYNDGMTWLLTDFMDPYFDKVFVRTH
jgi:hypothetical protein